MTHSLVDNEGGDSKRTRRALTSGEELAIKEVSGE